MNHNTLCYFPTTRGLDLFSNKMNPDSPSSSSNNLSLCLRKYNKVFLKSSDCALGSLQQVSVNNLQKQALRRGKKCEGSDRLATPVRATAPPALNSCSRTFAPFRSLFCPNSSLQMPTYSFCRASSMGFGGVCAVAGTRPRARCNAPCRDKQRSRAAWRSESKEGGSESGCDSRQSPVGGRLRLLLCASGSAATRW